MTALTSSEKAASGGIAKLLSVSRFLSWMICHTLTVLEGFNPARADGICHPSVFEKNTVNPCKTMITLFEICAIFFGVSPRVKVITIESKLWSGIYANCDSPANCRQS